MISLNNGSLTIQIDDNYLNENEGKFIDRLLNSKILIKHNTTNNVYTYDGLLFNNPTISTDANGNYVITVDDMDVAIPSANILDKDYDETKLSILCELFTTICTANIAITTETYEIDLTNNTIKFIPLNQSYSIVGDIPKLIVDYTDYVKTTFNYSTDNEAQQYIIDTELTNLSTLKDELENRARAIFKLYIQLSKYRSTV